jgi:hypothetical protein
MTASRGDAQEHTLDLLRALGFARTDAQVEDFRAQLAASTEKHTPEYWEQLRARLGMTTDRAA